MEQQPPHNVPDNLGQQVADLKSELSEVKELLLTLVRRIDDNFPLTGETNYRYYRDRELDYQQKNAPEGLPIISAGSKTADEPNPIPYIEEGQRATCSRCGHTWVPFVRRPKLCPACRQKWYKPKAWTRT